MGLEIETACVAHGLRLKAIHRWAGRSPAPGTAPVWGASYSPTRAGRRRIAAVVITSQSLLPMQSGYRTSGLHELNQLLAQSVSELISVHLEGQVVFTTGCQVSDFR